MGLNISVKNRQYDELPNWIAEYEAWAEVERKRRLLDRFCRTMYPTGWYHYGHATVRVWAQWGLSALGLI